ncbi:hypothetical protein [Mycobacteroides abscessus]|uniref:hypothetical protein n=1 Tax=Mycobacteroides abscessus TaxID=36809 RepID=UPI0002D84FDC|nr:hypothetical protein [Mycobacteroides abscessus]
MARRFGVSLAMAALVCEIRLVNLQERLRKAVADHGPSLATLRMDLEIVIPKVGQMWQEWFEDPRDVHGQAFCTCVRQVILRRRELRPPIPGDTLLTTRGNGLSVQIGDSHGMDFRSRRWPSKVLHGRRERIVTSPGGGELPLLRVKTKVGVQPPLDEDEPEQLFPSPIVTAAGTPDIFSLWWPTDDGWGLSEAVLAFVVDVDHASRVQILATEPLPPVTLSPLMSAKQPERGPRDGDDFADFELPMLETGEDPDESA